MITFIILRWLLTKTFSFKQVSWIIKGKPIEVLDSSNIFSTVNLLPGKTVEATVTVVKVPENFSGEWTCAVVAANDAPSSSATALKPSLAALMQRSINVLVIQPEAKLCQPVVTPTSHGTFRWSVAVGGHVVQQACAGNRQLQQLPGGYSFAHYLCKANGEWAASVNASQCAFASETTETLHKFAGMNTSFDSFTLLESARHLLNFTSNPEIFQDPLDVVFFAKAVENYLPYLRVNNFYQIFVSV